MARPAGDAEERLLKAGKELLEEAGFHSLSVRAVAQRAGVNIGLVNYHFGNKEKFVQQVATEVYEEFFRDFSLQVEGEADPFLALRKGLLRLSRFVRDHRKLVLGLLQDLARGEVEAAKFVRTNLPRHGIILAGLVMRCQQEGRLMPLPLGVVMTSMMGMVLFPTLVAEPFIGARFEFRPMADPDTFREILLSDQGLEVRVDLALKALRTDGGPAAAALKGGK